MARPSKLAVATAALWSLPAAVFLLATAVSGRLAVGVVAWVLAVGAARVVLRRAAGGGSAVATEHGVAGRIDAVEVFWRPGCPFVDGLGRSLDRAGVPVNLRNIRESPDDAAIVRSIAGGHETVPTLIIGPVALVNPSTKLVMATLRAHAPHLLGASEQPG